jgi:hypothetical protein
MVIMFFYSVVIKVSSTARVLDGAGGLYPVISIYQTMVHHLWVKESGTRWP